jgi:hypothetical protein
MEQLWTALQKNNMENAVSIIKDLIPEYISQNSTFEVLDKHNASSGIQVTQ